MIDWFLKFTYKIITSRYFLLKFHLQFKIAKLKKILKETIRNLKNVINLIGIVYIVPQCQCLAVWLDMFTWFKITCVVNFWQMFKACCIASNLYCTIHKQNHTKFYVENKLWPKKLLHFIPSVSLAGLFI